MKKIIVIAILSILLFGCDKQLNIHLSDKQSDLVTKLELKKDTTHKDGITDYITTKDILEIDGFPVSEYEFSKTTVIGFNKEGYLCGIAMSKFAPKSEKEIQPDFERLRKNLTNKYGNPINEEKNSWSEWDIKKDSAYIRLVTWSVADRDLLILGFFGKDYKKYCPKM